jgi:hypothetical protein
MLRMGANIQCIAFEVFAGNSAPFENVERYSAMHKEG